MVLGFSKLTRYYRKVRALGITRSVQTVGYKLFSYVKKGNEKPLPFLNTADFKIPEKLPFDFRCSSQLLAETEKNLKYDGINWRSDRSIDIRLLWEHARFQQAPLLAVAYQQTENQRYYDTLKEQIISWLDLPADEQKIYWFNAMETGLRSISWILSLVILGQEIKEDKIFFKRVIQSLREHLHFIEHNWEWYDGRTNNHYLSNIVGYAYLCWFFGRQDRLVWCRKQLENELDWQIFEEGTSYEGSTRYHALVTELFLHGFLVTGKQGERERDKLRRMLLFIERCKLSLSVRPSLPGEASREAWELVEGSFPITIGDDDSGQVMHPSLASLTDLAQQLGISCISQQELAGLHSYFQFGLSLYRDQQWHISLRPAAYQPRQPSAHFHDDKGSITIAYNGVPIIIDPGSYIYTASPEWRNFFRSAAQHSTIHQTGSSVTSGDLFALDLPTCDSKSSSFMATSFTVATATINRELFISDTSIMIHDSVAAQKSVSLTWNFIFAPTIQLNYENNFWHICLYDSTIFVFESDLIFEKYDAWYAPSYGTKVKTVALRATIRVDNKREYRSSFRSNGSTGSPRTI